MTTAVLTRPELNVGTQRNPGRCCVRADLTSIAPARIDSARSVPLEELERRIAELQADLEIVVYCRGKRYQPMA
jgi:hypothetical protein